MLLRYYVSMAGMHSPMGPVGMTGSGGSSGGSTFSSSSLNALQAISEGVGSSLPSTLTSPSHKSDSSPSINSTQPGQLNQSGANKGPNACETKSPASTPSTGTDQQYANTSETSTDKPDSQCNKDGQTGTDVQRKVPEGKGHKKLLQLLTSPTEELALGAGTGAPPPGRASTPIGADSKEAAGCMTSPSSTGVSSSSSASSGGTTVQHGSGCTSSTGCMGGHLSSHSLQEKHKILHKLLQNGNTPDEVARITAEATGKVSLGSEHQGSEGVGLEVKQEQHSPKKPNALLHYLLNKDDTKESGIEGKPGLDELEGRGVGTVGVTTTDSSSQDSKVKIEPLDEVCENVVMASIFSDDTLFCILIRFNPTPVPITILTQLFLFLPRCLS